MLSTRTTKKYKLIDRFLSELEWSTTRKYVELLRRRGDLLSLEGVDVDLPQILRRHFVCDARRCIHWVDGQALVDRSCCCRYEVPLTERDRQVVLAHLDQVRPFLPPDHRLLNPEEDPFHLDDQFDYSMVHDNPLDGCQFNLYLEGQCRCALHHAALVHGANPLDWKPLACSLWPLAVNDYEGEDQEDRFLLTIYCAENTELFDDAEDEPFACLVDQNAEYPQLYQAERSTLEYIFGPAWWKKLDQAAQQIMAQGKIKKKNHHRPKKGETKTSKGNNRPANKERAHTRSPQ